MDEMELDRNLPVPEDGEARTVPEAEEARSAPAEEPREEPEEIPAEAPRKRKRFKKSTRPSRLVRYNSRFSGLRSPLTAAMPTMLTPVPDKKS